jgi:Anti-sigma-K factor rskA
MNNGSHERLTDLLTDRAMQPLGETEARELEQLLAQFSDTDETQFDRAAAAIHLTEAMKPEVLPAQLKAKVIADAQQFFGVEEAPREAEPLASNVISFPTERVKRSAWQWAGWYAAAACLLLAVLAGWPRVKQVVTGKPPVPTIADNRTNLRSGAKDALQSNWTPTKYPNVQTVEGDVVWSSERQEGYMRFVNLAANDPAKSVYQLWIFDANQDEKYPVDGGVFNVSQSGEVIVPINAKLNVTKPTLFAVTIEKPGGVVVSKRDKLILTAKVG